MKTFVRSANQFKTLAFVAVAASLLLVAPAALAADDDNYSDRGRSSGATYTYGVDMYGY